MITRSWQLKATRVPSAVEDAPREQRDGETGLSDVAALLRRDARRKAARTLASLARRLTHKSGATGGA